MGKTLLLQGVLKADVLAFQLNNEITCLSAFLFSCFVDFCVLIACGVSSRQPPVLQYSPLKNCVSFPLNAYQEFSSISILASCYDRNE